MSDDLVYECPHCHEQVNVANALMGKMVDCPRCNQQFQTQAPLARPVADADHTDATPVVTREADAERTLREVHPVAFRNHLLLTLIAMLFAAAGVAAVVASATGSALLGFEGSQLLQAGSVLIVLSVLYFLYRWLQRISVTLKVTTERTVVVRGILSRSTNEVQHDDVRNIKSDRGILERLLNYGDIALSSSGQDDMEIVVHDIPNPTGIIEVIRNYQ